PVPWPLHSLFTGERREDSGRGRKRTGLSTIDERLSTHHPLSADQHGGGDDGRPEAFLVADRRLGDVLGSHDLIREPVDLLLLVPALVRIELEAKRRREHFGRELLGVVSRDVLAFSEAVMLREVAVQVAIA